jgi:signal transduction histidine kinase
VRQRLTASFVVLSVILLLGALGIRAYTTHDLLRSHESRELRRQVTQLALLIEQRQELGRPVDRMWLQGLVDPRKKIQYSVSGGSTVVVEGEAFDDSDSNDALSTTVDVDGGTLILTEDGNVLDELTDSNRNSLGFLVLLVALLAAAVGYVMARLVSRPFTQLAGAAGQLGRGRFDLDLPRTRIPEAKAISQALLTSAGQLQERLASEQAFAEHASHVLRTPLTGLRLELEDLAQRDDLPTDVREAATRSVGRIEAMNAVAGDLVSLARRGALVSGAQIPLRDLATQSAQSWADALAEQDRALTAAAEGNLEVTYTPGPVEHILDLLLADMLKRGQGAVRMVFEADEEGHLEIDLSCAGELRNDSGPHGDLPITQAKAVVTALGGRMTGEDPRRLTILLPRR